MQCLTLEQCDQWRDARCRRHNWKRQLTCVTPLKRLPLFTAVLVEHLRPFDHALLVIDQVVLGAPTQLDKLRRAAGESQPVHEAPGHTFSDDPEGFRAVLEAALSGWIDLRALFSPSKHALRADHDEYTTFFSESSGKIAEVRHALVKAAVEIAEYTAPAP
jgi:hypothetical protein